MGDNRIEEGLCTFLAIKLKEWTKIRKVTKPKRSSKKGVAYASLGVKLLSSK